MLTPYALFLALLYVINSENMNHRISNHDYNTILPALRKEASQEPRYVRFQERRDSGDMSVDVMHRSVVGKCQQCYSDLIKLHRVKQFLPKRATLL